MTEVQISSGIGGDARLWRYMSLDKLVDLLSTSELFFTPLASFFETDPYEGYLPAVAFEADASIYRPVVSDIKSAMLLVDKHRESCGNRLSDIERASLQNGLEKCSETPRLMYPLIAKAIVVNCWHRSEDESDAMWRLYSDQGKGIAVETSFCALKEAIKACDSKHRVHIYPVKYLNFFDSSLRPQDCVVEGHRAPLLKRISYEHEKEVRAFIGRGSADPREAANPEFWRPIPVRLPIALKTLVKAVHISPYSKEPFQTSVKAVCRIFGLDDGIVQPSKLLSGHEELLNRLSV